MFLWFYPKYTALQLGRPKSSPREKNREQLQDLKVCHGIFEGTLPELT